MENSAVATVSATLDGAGVPAAFDAPSGRAKVLPGQPLDNDVDHRVAVRVTDTAGLSADIAWTFHVQIYPSIPAETIACTTCHSGYHSTDNCAACHGEDCGSCHDGHGGLTFGASECVGCHSGSAHHDLDARHRTTRDMAPCSPCHVAELSIEHYRYGDAAGNPLSCATCHSSTDPRVVAAVAGGFSDCAVCHTLGSGGASHITQHPDVALSAECLGCHQANVVTEHLSNPRTQAAALTCETCHENADPRVTAAISAGGADCADCHDAPHAWARRAAHRGRRPECGMRRGRLSRQ